MFFRIIASSPSSYLFLFSLDSNFQLLNITHITTKSSVNSPTDSESTHEPIYKIAYFYNSPNLFHLHHVSSSVLCLS